ncbi:MAG TPA: radical SAM protein, partial [Rectinema sp.]|nr:radical SAM protein [Rectinema sp.]
WGFKYALKFIGKRASLPPLGLCTVAALLPEGYECRLVDMNVSRLSTEDILWADMVFISAMLVQKASFEEVVRRCNALKRMVVAGGPYPTSRNGEIEGVNHFVLNEAEITLPRFLDDLERGTPLRIYSDSTKADMRDTPVPRFDLLEIKRYNSLALQFSRGCPFSCEFCDIIEMFGRVPRTKPVSHFLDEMERILALGFRGSIFVVDDNFIGNAARVKELLREIETWQRRNARPFSFFTEASVNLAQDDELLDLMVRAGFEMVFLGIESPAEESLQSAGKRQNLRGDLLGSVEKIQRAGLEVCGGFIVGFDTDTSDIFGRQFEFIQSSAIPGAMMGLLTALPNTKLYRRLRSENRLLCETSGNNTHELDVNFIPVMERDELLKGYKEVM